MKAKIIFLAISLLILISCKSNTKFSEKERLVILQSQEFSLRNIQQNDTLLNNIEQKVYNAFVKDLLNQADSELVSLEQSLLALNKIKNNGIIVYWYSYTCYYHSIFSLTQNDLKKTEKFNDKGIEKLEEVNPKNSEHYALLALMESFSIKYSSVGKIPFISASLKKNAEKAIELDSLNLRAYYVLGSNDFYTPEQYGGGKKTEGYLKRAIRLNIQSINNPYLPSWGKSLAYEMLVRYYIKHNLLDEAKKYYQEAKGLFPNDYMIKRLQSELNKKASQNSNQQDH